ncbi:MAG: phosphoribosylformylglycinamidine cyclo-ligase [Proteobacteria bacterium]|nr:phosphoribosylformylglycinamidine cyclo-ligase [Pseudomonadota bacterium]
MSEQYKKAGVDIDAGNRFVEMIRPMVKATHRRGVVSDLGGYGGLFSLCELGLEDPVLVSGTDGVGTKLRIAIEMNRFDTIGIDLVAMCVNDIACSGAEPLFFLDYFATSRLMPERHSEIVKGIAEACKKTGCALIGGETAEMPDMYAEGDFDLAGFAVGAAERSRIIDGSSIGIGNSIVGVASTGFHSNGFSLVRRIVREAKLDLGRVYDGLERPLGEALLTPTALYSPLVAQLARSFELKGVAHITGGGFWDNIPRILPAGVRAEIDRKAWMIPEIFRFFQTNGGIEDEEMLRVFNCGVGMVLVIPADQLPGVIDSARIAGFEAFKIGSIAKRRGGEPQVTVG